VAESVIPQQVPPSRYNMNIKSTTICNITPCSVVEFIDVSEEKYFHNLQGMRVKYGVK
jgi:hypothetical protein